jgi:hypothetical protein
MPLVAITGQLKLQPGKPENIAERLGRYLESVADFDPQFYRWIRQGTRRHRSAVPAAVTMPPDAAELSSWIAESAKFESRNGRKQHVGYALRVLTPEDNRVRADFWLTVDFTESAWWFLNRVGVTFFQESGGSRATERNPQDTVGFFRQAILNLATIWDCDWAAVREGDFRWDDERPANVPLPRYRSGWIVYLDPSLAAGIAEPQDVPVERLANGAVLLTAVTNNVFNPHDPIHRAAAQRIQAALAPLNQPSAPTGD